ncbi:MAG TPA: universal stress protein [Acidimicrobiales bacterium]|jgi:nucleotide-binding universal stress UspA family protein
MAGDIILGYDGSDGSKAALAVAVSVARAFDAPLSIVFGYEPNPMGGETADYKDKLEKIGDDMVGAAVAAAKKLDGGVRVEALVVPLRPVESLLEAAVERTARVIVVGGSGERPLVGAILGSVPHKLLHRSHVPVLVVPAGDE